MALEFKQVGHFYRGYQKTDRFQAILDVDLKIEGKNEFIAICGQTGSGKTTLVQHMNGLLRPTSGEVHIFDTVIGVKNKRLKLNPVRKRVGLVFQFPEYQLFEETVLKDIMFGPKNFGSSKEEAEKQARFAASLVGLDEDILQKSPFKISGGQMRRVAIAGILAMQPDILVLDEPTRGLDPQGRKEIMGLFSRIHHDLHKTIVLITHDMDVVGEYVKRVIVMKDGKKAFDGPKEQLFQHPDFQSFHLDKPSVLRAVDHLNNTLHLDLPPTLFTMDALLKALRQKVGDHQ